MDSPKPNSDPIVDSEMIDDPESKVETHLDPQPESDPDSKIESDPNPKPNSQSSAAAAKSTSSNMTAAEFMKSVTDFYAERGTPLDLEPRVSGRPVNLYTLYNAVISRGGYDAVCEAKLAWRKVGELFHLPTINAAAHAFALKSVYYYNLAAYEIKNFHHREPPPKEILEDLTPKGGDLLNRTMENHQGQPKRRIASNEPTGIISGDEIIKTPTEEKIDVVDPTDSGAGGVRSTRGLRKAPAQRIPFQPDVSSSRQVRHSSSFSHSSPPQPANDNSASNHHQNIYEDSGIAATIKNFEPKPPVPLTLRNVVTPRNNPGLFNEKLRVAQEAKALQSGQPPSSVAEGMMKPGAGYEGPNIYVRILLSLRSMVPAEQDYALHHLVKISHERGDKYKVEAFPTLAETLIEYALGVSSLFYNVQWEVDYTEKKFDINTLDGINGTPDILQRIQSLKRIDCADELEPEELAHRFTKINEAGLALRNLTTLEDNAIYFSTLPQLRDFLTIVLNLPDSDWVTELKLNILDMAEEITKYWSMDVSDPLYRSLLDQIAKSNDRGVILKALRAISKTSFELEEPNSIRGIPVSTIGRLFDWLLLEDEELVKACLDFLYQFVAISDNVSLLIAHADELSLLSLMAQFGNLLQHGLREVTEKVLVHPAIPPAPAKDIPTVPRELLNQFLQYDEPDRSNRWLKSVLEENPESDVTQIALWQAYQSTFGPFATPQKGLLVASDFIKHVSTVFAGANAQVVTGPSSKFIIKGIQPRHVPIDGKGRQCLQCKWKAPTADAPCGQFLLEAIDLYYHFISNHLNLPLDEASRKARPTEPAPFSDCYWAGCHHFSRVAPNAPPPSSDRLCQHFRQHLPHGSSKTPDQPANAEESPYAVVTSFRPEELAKAPTTENFPMGRPAIYREIKHEVTSADETGEPTGIALCAVLVLRNIARNLPEALFLLGRQTPHGGGFLQREDPVRSVEAWMAKLFGQLKWPLARLWASNRALGAYAFDTMALVRKFKGF